jgi:hypothetical protein
VKSIIEDFTELGNKLSELEGKPKAEPSGASKLCPKCKGTGKYVDRVVKGMPQWKDCEYCLGAQAAPPSRQVPWPPTMRQVRKFCTQCLGKGCASCSGKGYHEVVEPAAAPPDGWAHKDPGVAIWQCKNCGNSDFTDHPNDLRGCDSCGFVYQSCCYSCASGRIGLATDGSAYICHDCGYWQ